MIIHRTKALLAGAGFVLALIFFGANVQPPQPNLDTPLVPPSKDHWLGTSPEGRDVALLCLTAMFRATGESLFATMLSLVTGLLVGLIAAVQPGGVFDRIQSVVAKLLDCIGPFLLAACLAAIAPRLSSWKLALFLAIVTWPNVSIVVRSESLLIARLPFVEAARAVGVNFLPLTLNYYLPEMLDRLAPLMLGLFGSFIAIFGALGFIGVGASTETGLGFMLFDAQSYIRTAPWYWGSCFASLLVLLLLAGVTAKALKAPHPKSR